MRYGWRQSALPPDSCAPSPLYEIHGGQEDACTEPRLRESLEWRTPLVRVPSGSYSLPETVDWGDLPGRESPNPLLEGMPLALPGHPETPPDAVGLLWVSSMRLRPPDPIRLPNNSTGGPLLEIALAGSDSGPAMSGARLTTGTSGTYTEEIFLARPTGSGLLRLFYGDHKTGGRLLYYGPAIGENLLARFDRGTSWGGWHLGWRRHYARASILAKGQWFWNRSAMDAGATWRVRDWSVEADGSVSWDRLAWESLEDPLDRRSGLWQGLLRAIGPGTRFRPLVSLQLDLQQQRFHDAAGLTLDRQNNGLGLATGVEGVSKGWRYRASVGRANPDYKRSGWVAACDAERTLAEAWTLRGQFDRTVRPPVLPRLGNELRTEVAQGIAVPVPDPDRPLEGVLRGEVGICWSRPGRQAAFRVRVVDIRHTVSAGGGLLPYFSPGGYAFLPRSALDQTVRVAALHTETGTDLPRGFRLETQGAVRVSDPAWKENLWMTPWEGRAILSWHHIFFKGSLDARGFVRGIFAGRRATPQGSLPWSDRFEAGVVGGIGPASLFLLLVNLEDDVREAAAYDGGWLVQPLRSYRMGLTWRFVD